MTLYQQSRRCFLRRTSALAALAVAGCATTASPVVVSAAVTAAVAAIQGVIADVTAAIAAGSLTPAQLADAQIRLASLNAQIVALNTSATTPSAAVDSVTAILAQLGTYLPLLLPVIGMLASNVTPPPETALQTSLRAHMAALRAAAGRSL